MPDASVISSICIITFLVSITLSFDKTRVVLCIPLLPLTIGVVKILQTENVYSTANEVNQQCHILHSYRDITYCPCISLNIYRPFLMQKLCTKILVTWLILMTAWWVTFLYACAHSYIKKIESLQPLHVHKHPEAERSMYTYACTCMFNYMKKSPSCEAVSQPVKKFCIFYVTGCFITTFSLS
jgi:hypothetical protein